MWTPGNVQMVNQRTVCQRHNNIHCKVQLCTDVSSFTKEKHKIHRNNLKQTKKIINENQSLLFHFCSPELETFEAGFDKKDGIPGKYGK